MTGTRTAMEEKKKIELRPIESNDPDTVRIYTLTKEACDRLNSYYLDFVETIRILQENRDRALREGDSAKAAEIQESITFVQAKIHEVADSMRTIADEMDSLVELK